MKIYDVLGNSQSLDGGAMFGNAPKALWSRWHAADEHNRIAIACRALLVDTGEQRVLLETGIGAFFSPALKQRYGVVESDHVLLGSLARLGVDHAQIDVVISSHLHFDHAGGLLAAYQENSPPALLFPNARYVVSRAALERAKHPHVRDRASFIPELPGLLEASGRLVVVEDEHAGVKSLQPHFQFSTTDGHTPGMLHTLVMGAAHQVFFCADLIPGRAWVHAPITMGYDRFPERLIEEKEMHLSRFERDGTWLFFTHDPEVAAARVARDERGKFGTKEPCTSFPLGWDLNATSLID
jgi:glyoxylase-like metal-dependent hydrolase (beta-lactamase superfamily II)